MSAIKNPYNFFESFGLRVPVLPLDHFFSLCQQSILRPEDYTALWEVPEIKEGILIASPELFTALNRRFSDQIRDQKKVRRLDQALLKYSLRASTRCTPFGIFSGVCMGRFGNETHLELKDTASYSRKTRLDMRLLIQLSNHLEQDSAIQEELHFSPNNSLYRLGSTYRYIAYQDKGDQRSFSVEGTRITKHLEQVLHEASEGKSMNVLSRVLISEEITEEAARNYVQTLVENQILVSSLTPTLCGENYFQNIIALIHRSKARQKFAALGTALSNKLTTNNCATEPQWSNDSCVDTVLREYDIPVDKKLFFQTDLFIKTQKNTLAYKHVYAIKKLIPLLNKLTAYDETEALNAFKLAFVQRYESQEVPLVQALDIETGIGYLQNHRVSNTTPDISDLLPDAVDQHQQHRVTKVDTIIEDTLRETLQRQRHTMELTLDDFETVHASWDDLPDTMTAIGNLVLIEGQERLVLYSIRGSSAANLYTRFAYGDPDIAAHVDDIIEKESQMNPSKLVAEIVHLPSPKAGNIVRRSLSRSHEIPILEASKQPEEQQLYVGDLMLSVRSNTLRIRSKKHNKEVLPRLSCAHLYQTKGLVLYQFLCDMQFASRPRNKLGFFWPKHLLDAAFLPRVMAQNTILSLARWTIKRTSIAYLYQDNLANDRLLEQTRAWRSQLHMPRHVQWTTHDHCLPIDLESPTMIQLLLDSVRTSKDFVLEEFLCQERTSVNRGDATFSNEFLISFYNERRLSKEKPNEQT